jgi:hypothetical protein
VIWSGVVAIGKYSIADVHNSTNTIQLPPARGIAVAASIRISVASPQCELQVNFKWTQCFQIAWQLCPSIKDDPKASFDKVSMVP